MLKKAGVIIGGELILFLGLFGLFALQKDQEKSELITRSNMVALFYANPAHSYQESYRREFYDLGYSGPGAIFKNQLRGKNVNSYNQVKFSEFAVILKNDIDGSSDPHLKHAFYYPNVNRIQEYNDTVAVNLPLFRDGEKTPYGLIRIEHNLKNMPRDIFYKNLLSYILIGIFFNGFLLALIFGMFRKPKETLVYLEKGYLKDYALGALKLHHKILSQIIEDHESDRRGPEKDEKTGNPGSPGVIKLDPAARRKDNK